MRTGHARDQDLLLLSHDALPPWRRALVAAHLRRCAACRQSYERLAWVSRGVAEAIREPSDVRWRPAARPRTSAPATFWLAVTVLLLTVGLAWVWSVRHAQTAPGLRHYSTPCRPDLPNDHCR